MQKDSNTKKLKTYGLQNPNGDIIAYGDIRKIEDMVWQHNTELAIKLKCITSQSQNQEFQNQKMTIKRIK